MTTSFPPLPSSKSAYSLLLHCFSLNLQSVSFHLSLSPSLFVSVALPLFGRGACLWDLEEIELNYEGISLQYDWHHFLLTIEHHSHISQCGGMKIGRAPFFLSSF